jgi:hypothetical protein
MGEGDRRTNISEEFRDLLDTSGIDRFFPVRN